MTSTGNDRSEAVREALREVMDPELALNIVDLGMVTDIRCEDGRTTVSMVLTTMTCPFWELFTAQVQDALRDVPHVGEVAVRHDPRRRWTPELMADEARWELEIAGLLPTSTWLAAG
jgi:metal-sulfur cluster biosynthetic enzyme